MKTPPERAGKTGKVGSVKNVRKVRRGQTEGEAAKAMVGKSSFVLEAEEGPGAMSITAARQR